MLIHPQINPVALQLGPLAIHWYGLTYLAAFGLFMLLGFRRLKHQPYARLAGETSGKWSKRDVEDILFDVINYAVENPSQNVLKDYARDSVLQIAQILVFHR